MDILLARARVWAVDLAPVGSLVECTADLAVVATAS
jgi:hypothetical protein